MTTASAQDTRMPLWAHLPEVCMVDRQRQEMFSALARHRTLFGGIANWPWIDEALAEKSALILEEKGESYWQEVGGE